MGRDHWFFVGLALATLAGCKTPPADPTLEYRLRGDIRNLTRKSVPHAIWVNTPEPGSLPARVSHHTYHSESMGHDVGYCLYLPPGYETAQDLRYPVIYHLHQVMGDELHAVQNFDDTKVLHEGILTGKWPPMIMVLPNGGQNTFYKDSYDGKFLSETTLIRELIPHIDRTYRTIAARHGRCIEGFSMGGRGATRLALKYPDLFCSLFCQAGNVLRIAALHEPSRPDLYPNSYLGPDRERYVENDPFLLLSKNRERIRNRLRILLMSGTADREHLTSLREFHQALLDADVDHTYIEIEGMGHDKNEMLAMFREIWFDYHVESLRRAASAAEPR